MAKSIQLRYKTQPSLLLAYGRALLMRRPPLVPAGETVPEIKASINGLTINQQHLAAYRKNCGFLANGFLPLTYPHILASRMHMAMLTSEAFPIQLMGIIHVANKIEAVRAIAEHEQLDLYCFISGHQETERGQEFQMVTDAYVTGQRVWSETSTFLARRRSSEKAKPKLAERGNEVTAAVALTKLDLKANLAITRRYAVISGDFNPIHLTKITAKLLGFARPIAHGMWSLARIAAEIAPPRAEQLTFEVNFKLPILLPAKLRLEYWPTSDGSEFVLKDDKEAKPHITGNLVLGKRLTGR